MSLRIAKTIRRKGVHTEAISAPKISAPKIQKVPMGLVPPIGGDKIYENEMRKAIKAKVKIPPRMGELG